MTLVLALQRQGASGVEVSILVISEVLPIVVLGKLIGRVVDRFDSRTLLVVSGLAQVLACLFLAQADRFGTLIAGAVALAAASAVALPTRQALVPAIVSRDDLPRANAIGQTAGSAGMMLGPALAGVMVAAYGPEPTILIAGRGVHLDDPGRPAASGPAGAGVRRLPPCPTLRRPSRRAGNEWTLRSDRLLWSSVWGLTAVMCSALRGQRGARLLHHAHAGQFRDALRHRRCHVDGRPGRGCLAVQPADPSVDGRRGPGSLACSACWPVSRRRSCWSA